MPWTTGCCVSKEERQLHSVKHFKTLKLNCILSGKKKKNCSQKSQPFHQVTWNHLNLSDFSAITALITFLNEIPCLWFLRIFLFCLSALSVFQGVVRASQCCTRVSRGRGTQLTGYRASQSLLGVQTLPQQCLSLHHTWAPLPSPSLLHAPIFNLACCSWAQVESRLACV